MNLFLLLHTISHLKQKQIMFQIKSRLIKTRFQAKEYNGNVCTCKCFPNILKCICYKNGVFSFINISSPFTSWNDSSNGMLWAYNLNYMDWLQQEGIMFEECRIWIDRFIDEIPTNKVGMDPYPIALRGINWIKFISQYKKYITDERLKRWNDSLYSQYCLLEKKLEYHLLGNHLLEDAYSLFIAAIYFSDKGFYNKSVKILRKELNEQILNDGANFEQSPMYHCILLDRLLDCYNFSISNKRFENQDEITNLFRQKAVCMLGYLQSILYSDGTYPLFNDSAKGIAPEPKDLFDYARRLGIEWQPMAMKESGYRRMKSEFLEAFVDVGGITASYQPGHSHADTFNYELRVNGIPFIVDTGISTYNKTERRQYERGTSAHNTVSVKGKNSSEVWGGFRVGRRAKVFVKSDASKFVTAYHNGFDKLGIHERTFSLDEKTFSIEDRFSGSCEAVSYIHLAEEVSVNEYSCNTVKTNIAEIHVEGADSVIVKDCMISDEYNKFKKSKVIEIRFKKQLKYKIAL